MKNSVRESVSNILQIIQDNITSIKEHNEIFDNAQRITIVKKNDHEDLLKKIGQDGFVSEQDYQNMKNILQRVLENQQSNYIFSLLRLKKAVLSDENLSHSANETYLIDRILIDFVSFDSQTNELDDEIIFIGDKKLDLFTTRKRLKDEIALIQHIVHKRSSHPVGIERDLVEQKIREVNQANKEFKLSEQQMNLIRACTLTDHWCSASIGLAGAGKTSSLKAVIALYKEKGFHTIGATLSNKAAEVLQNESKMQCYSISHVLQMLKKRKENKANILDKPLLLIVDEAGLVGVKEMIELIEYLNESEHPIKMILSGDPTQLDPIGQPNSLELIEKILPNECKAITTEIRRQLAASHRQAVLDFREGKAGQGLYVYHQEGNIKLKENDRELSEQVIQDYLAARRANQFDPHYSSLIIGLDRKMVSEISSKIRDGLMELGIVDKHSITIPVLNEHGFIVSKNFSLGDQIVFTKNMHNIPLLNKESNQPYNAFIMNRTQGVISAIKGNKETGYILDVDIVYEGEDSGNKQVVAYTRVNTREIYNNTEKFYCPIDLNYAMTAYSSQGQTVKDVFLIDGASMNRKLAYVSASRHRENLVIYLNKNNIRHRIESRVKSDVEELSTLDYIDFVAQTWSRESNQNSIIIKVMSVLEDLKAIKKANPTIGISFNQLPEAKQWQEIYLKYANRKKEQFLEKAQYQASSQHVPILDNPRYYTPIMHFIDQENSRGQSFKPPIDIRQITPIEASLLQKPKYHLSAVMTQELFETFKGKYFDVGVGGEICFISKINNKK